MKVLLVPWVKSSSIVALRIYLDGDKIFPDSYAAEIPTVRGQRIALALVQKHAESLRLSIPSFLKSSRMTAEVELPEDVGERLLFALKHLGHIVCSRKIPEKLAENPTLESLERFLFVGKLLE